MAHHYEASAAAQSHNTWVPFLRLMMKQYEDFAQSESRKNPFTKHVELRNRRIERRERRRFLKRVARG